MPHSHRRKSYWTPKHRTLETPEIRTPASSKRERHRRRRRRRSRLHREDASEFDLSRDVESPPLAAKPVECSITAEREGSSTTGYQDGTQTDLSRTYLVQRPVKHWIVADVASLPLQAPSSSPAPAPASVSASMSVVSAPAPRSRREELVSAHARRTTATPSFRRAPDVGLGVPFVGVGGLTGGIEGLLKDWESGSESESDEEGVMQVGNAVRGSFAESFADRINAPAPEWGEGVEDGLVEGAVESSAAEGEGGDEEVVMQEEHTSPGSFAESAVERIDRPEPGLRKEDEPSSEAVELSAVESEDDDAGRIVTGEMRFETPPLPDLDKAIPSDVFESAVSFRQVAASPAPAKEYRHVGTIPSSQATVESRIPESMPGTQVPNPTVQSLELLPESPTWPAHAGIARTMSSIDAGESPREHGSPASGKDVSEPAAALQSEVNDPSSAVQQSQDRGVLDAVHDVCQYLFSDSPPSPSALSPPQIHLPGAKTEAPLETQVDSRPDQTTTSATTKLKRKMTGMTSKHFSPQKRARISATTQKDAITLDCEVTEASSSLVSASQEINATPLTPQSDAHPEDTKPAESKAHPEDETPPESKAHHKDEPPVESNTHHENTKPPDQPLQPTHSPPSPPKPLPSTSSIPPQIPKPKPKSKRKSTGKTSAHFVPSSLIDPTLWDRADLHKSGAKRPGLPGSSVCAAPPLSAQNFGLIQEKLYLEPFWLLVAVILLNQTTGRAATPTLWWLKNNYRDIASLAATDQATLCKQITHLGLQNQRSRTLIALAKMWIADPPVKTRRHRVLHYPNPNDGKAYPPGTILDDSTPSDICAGALEIAHLPGCKSYAFDSWRIFCRDILRGKAEDFRGTGATEEAFQPEWKRVRPADKELRACLRWMWLKEGWVWDPDTGEKRRASEEEMRMGEIGEMEVRDEVERGFLWDAARRGSGAGEGEGEGAGDGEDEREEDVMVEGQVT